MRTGITAVTISFDDPFWQGVAAAILGGIVGGAFGLLGALITNGSVTKRERYARLSDALARVAAGFTDVAYVAAAAMVGTRTRDDTNAKISELNRAVTDCHLLVRARMRPILWHLIRAVAIISQKASEGATISLQTGRAIGDLSTKLATAFQEYARREVGLDDRSLIKKAWQRFRIGSWYDQFMRQLQKAVGANSETEPSKDESGG